MAFFFYVVKTFSRLTDHANYISYSEINKGWFYKEPAATDNFEFNQCHGSILK